MSIVQCEQIYKTYHQGKIKVQALRGVNLEVEKGGFVALSGPSGSGKTTMLNIIGGLDLADSGQVVVDGNSFEQMSQSQLAEMRLNKVGFVFQAYNLVPVLSALENVEFVMLLQGVPVEERRRRARGILDEVGLEGMYDRRPRELSGGQQQRVAVARAIVADPAIVLADEPTANLDEANSTRVEDLVRDYRLESGATILWVGHKKSQLARIADRIIDLSDGQFTDTGGGS